MKKTVLLSALCSLLIFLTSCSKRDFKIKEFNPLSNFEFPEDTLSLAMDLQNAVVDGIILPSSRDEKKYFCFEFKIINTSGTDKAFFYKIYYQNESYKHPEFIASLFSKDYNPESGLNFYGSWDNPTDSFRCSAIIPSDGKWHTVKDSFRIVGNPRFEEKYFGAVPTGNQRDNELIKSKMDGIRNTPEWFAAIKEKALANKLDIEEQLMRDAIWVINEDKQKGRENNPWKRNPRTGCYSFALCVVSPEEYNKLPEHLTHLSKTGIDEKFVNPYYELFGKSPFFNKTPWKAVRSEKVLKTYAEFDVSSGIYVDELHYPGNPINTAYSKQCGNSDSLFYRAHFEQYFHNIVPNENIYNIPISYDVTGDNYTQSDYQKNSLLYPTQKRIGNYITNTDCPCNSLKVDTLEKAIWLINPGMENGKLKKENVGVNTRIGFTYGKYIARIQFPEIISRDNVWNGLTCAFWLKFQSDKEWNYRSECQGEGYLSKAVDGAASPRLKTTHYTEIDFEILKTSVHWPASAYEDQKNIPLDNSALHRNIVVACTNWDLACTSPKNFNIGAKPFVYNKQHFTTQRWDEWYKALTIKHSEPHDSLFGRYYYYEIDWQPDKIIWRIGLNRESMKVIAVMDNTISKIPDNQMIMVFTQEFHDSEWWPLSPFLQDLIPFPKNKITGRISEVRIE